MATRVQIRHKFVFLIQCGLFFGLRQTSAHDSAVRFIKNSSVIEAETGKVYDAFLTPQGGISMSQTSRGEAGEAEFNYVVKGAKKFMDVNLLMEKDFDTGWQIHINE